MQNEADHLQSEAEQILRFRYESDSAKRNREPEPILRFRSESDFAKRKREAEQLQSEAEQLLLEG